MEEKQLKYYKMHHDLEEQIHRGELRAGDRVPSENQLAAAYQVSRQTVRKALAILEQEGYIYPVKGRGNYVSGNEELKVKKQESVYKSLRELVQKGKELDISREMFLRKAEEYYGRGEEEQKS